MAQVAILLKVTVKQSQSCRSPARFLSHPCSSLTAPRLDSARLSQQISRRHFFQISHSTHQQMSRFLISRSTPNRAISNTGSPCSGNAFIAMCPPVSHAAGNGFTSTGVPAGSAASFEAFICDMFVRQSDQFTILTNNIASIQRQLSEHNDMPSCTQEWMHAQQARSADIDKTLASLHASMDALESASVSSVVTKSVVSDWLLRKIAGSASSSSTSQSHTPGESEDDSQSPGNREKPSFSPAQKEPEEWYQQDEEFLRGAVLVGFLCGQNKDSVQKFCAVSFPDVDTDSYEIKCKTVTMPVSYSAPSRNVINSLLLAQGRVPFLNREPSGSAPVR